MAPEFRWIILSITLLDNFSSTKTPKNIIDVFVSEYWIEYWILLAQKFSDWMLAEE